MGDPLQHDDGDGPEGRLPAGFGVRFGVLVAEDAGRPVAAPLERCAELLGVPVEAAQLAAGQVAPYWRADGEPVWSLRLLGEALGRVRPSRQKRRQEARAAGRDRSGG